MDLVHVEREKDTLSAELAARKQELETTKQLMENQRVEERKLRKIISEASAERTRQKKELEQVWGLCRTLILLIHVFFSLGNNWTWHSWHSAHSQKWRAVIALREDQDPAIHAEQGGDTILPEARGYTDTETRDQEDETGEEYAIQECC